MPWMIAKLNGKEKRKRTDTVTAKEKKTDSNDDLNEEYPQTDNSNASKEKRQRTGVDEPLESRLLSIMDMIRYDMKTCMSNVESRLSNVESRLSRMESQLSGIQTNAFTIMRTGDDLQTSFEKNVEERDEQYEKLRDDVRRMEYTLDRTKDGVDDVKRKITRFAN